MDALFQFFTLAITAVLSWVGIGTVPARLIDTVATTTPQTIVQEITSPVSPAHVPVVVPPESASVKRGYTHDELLAVADNTYANGMVPLGDYHYVTEGPKKGYVYLCRVREDNPGSMVSGPWMGSDSWNFLKKVSVEGVVPWPNARFSNLTSGTNRTLSGNALPVSHTTGVFPVSRSSEAGQYDPNPNTISEQSLRVSIPKNPTYSETPYCMGGEVGIMLTGVPLFNAFDAGLRDAPAHELQDSCGGHPQGSGEYHYHSLSSCFKDTSVSTVLGYAYDGFPITGGKVADKKFLTTEDLDKCHGLTSEVMIDGKKVTTYHYVMTRDFPYSVSCFRGKPVTTGPSVGMGQGGQGKRQEGGVPGGPPAGGPPQEAVNACSGKSAGDRCSFITPFGDAVSGACDTPPQSSLACVPR